MTRPDRLRWVVAWIGIATLAALSALAFVHLLLDVAPVLGIRGGWSSRLLRLLPVALLSLAAVALAIVVAWLAGSSRRRELVAIGVALLVLVGVRAVLAAEFDSDLTGEPGTYRAMADSLLAGDADFRGRPMAYAFALAGAFALIPDRQLGIEAVNLLVSLLAGGVVLGLARGLYGPRAGALALLGFALWPAGALMTVVSIPQLACDLAIAAAVWAAVGTPPGWRGDALSGVLLGVSHYLRPTAPALLPGIVLARLWRGGPRRTLIGAVLIPIAAFGLAILPVVAYNLARTGSLSVSTSDWGGQVFYVGTSVESGGMYTKALDRELTELAEQRNADKSAIGTEIALQRIREDPIGIAALGIRKQDTLWGTEHYGVQYAIGERFRYRPEERRATAPMLLSQVFYVVVLVTAMAGLWLQRRKPDALVPIVVTFIWTVAAMHALLEVRDRHHSYVIPLLLPLSALALATAWSSIERRFPSRQAA